MGYWNADNITWQPGLILKGYWPPGDQVYRDDLTFLIKGIVTDSNNVFLWHESEDINKKSLFPKFQLIPSSNFQVMHDYVCFIAPIDYCVK